MSTRYRAYGTNAKEMTPIFKTLPPDGGCGDSSAEPTHLLALALNLGGSHGAITHVPIGDSRIVAMQAANYVITNTLREQGYHVHANEHCLVAVRCAIGTLTPFPRLLMTGDKPKWLLEATGAAIEFHNPICGVHRLDGATMHFHSDIAKYRDKAIRVLTEFKNWVTFQPPLSSPEVEVLQHTVISPLPSQPYCSPLWGQRFGTV